MNIIEFRRHYLTRPLLARLRRAMPNLSDTEREALEAGTVWWDADLFEGNPDWNKLLATPAVELSAEERRFLEGPVRQLCAMLDDWRVNTEWCGLPEEVWQYMRDEGFFGMIIPQAYGGLGFSASAQSEVIRTLSTRSLAAAVTVMVPNSLGPGELLLEYGTEAQKDYWLPRLADGREFPCFGLTSPEAGSDAASMTDHGVVCRGEHEGREVLGIRLNWHKRYITLCPVATVLGLAFKLYDPDGLLGGEDDLGITVALIPMDTPGVETGRRHLPAMQMFQNGPTLGHDVFAPMDWVIGGEPQLGQGWKMLMSALAAGRGISLPSMSAGAGALCAQSTSDYARAREQFGVPIERFEGIQRRLARLAASVYLLDAARRLTCNGLDQGHKLAVISAVMKAHATYRMRDAVLDAMDVHAGKAVIDGPLNYLGNVYRSVPVGITVEGANILTRNLIIYGQGAIRCHPHLLDEILALQLDDEDEGLERFDRALWAHVCHALVTTGRAWFRTWTGGRFAPAANVGAATPYCRALSRYCAAFALISEAALLTLGGTLKRKELLSARLGDVLSELYLLSAVLKRFDEEGRLDEDLPLLKYCMEEGFATIESRFQAVLSNLPSRAAALVTRLIIAPLGPTHHGPSDDLLRACAHRLGAGGDARARLFQGVFVSDDPDDGLARVQHAANAARGTQKLRDLMKENNVDDIAQAHDQGLLSASEMAELEAAVEAVNRAIEVDSFEPEAFGAMVRAGDDGERSQDGVLREVGNG